MAKHVIVVVPDLDPDVAVTVTDPGVVQYTENVARPVVVVAVNVPETELGLDVIVTELEVVHALLDWSYSETNKENEV